MTNSSTNTDLKDFLAKFSDYSGKHVNQINPINTFEVEFTFYPSIDSDALIEKTHKALETLTTPVGITAAKIGVNFGKNIITNVFNENSVLNSHNNFNNQGVQTFLKYLITANQMIGNESELMSSINNSQSITPLVLQLGYYVQSIEIPLIKINDGGKSVSSIGEFPINGQYVQTDNYNLTMTILNTKLPLIERLFYPWMKEVTLPLWSYTTQPYTTATITIDFNKHTDLKYVFCGCRPVSIEAFRANQANDEVTKRQVIFLFDQLYITSNLTVSDNSNYFNDKISMIGSTVLNTII